MPWRDEEGWVLPIRWARRRDSSDMDGDEPPAALGGTLPPAEVFCSGPPIAIQDGRIVVGWKQQAFCDRFLGKSLMKRLGHDERNDLMAGPATPQELFDWPLYMVKLMITASRKNMFGLGHCEHTFMENMIRTHSCSRFV